MAVRGLTMSSTKTHVYSGDADAGTPNETKFILKPIDVFIQTAVFDAGLNLSDETANTFKVYRMNLESVRFGLAGWENFIDEKGNQVEFKTSDILVTGKRYSAVDPDLLRLLPFAVISELAREIRNLSKVTEDEAKN
jgi:hypothetical protein